MDLISNILITHKVIFGTFPKFKALALPQTPTRFIVMITVANNLKLLPLYTILNKPNGLGRYKS